METGVGRLIAQLRAEREMSQSQLADLLTRASGNPAITRNEISRWEQGKRRPRRYWLEWIAFVFGMSILDIEDLAKLAAPMVDTDEAEAIELRHRVAASDVGRVTLEKLEATVDDLAISYPTTPPDLLLLRVRRQLRPGRPAGCGGSTPDRGLPRRAQRPRGAVGLGAGDRGVAGGHGWGLPAGDQAQSGCAGHRATRQFSVHPGDRAGGSRARPTRPHP